MANLSGVVIQLRRERARVSRELERLDNAIAALGHISGRSNGRRSTASLSRRPRRKLSAAARARIAAAQRARWARVKAKLAKKAA